MFDPKQLTSGWSLTWPRTLFQSELSFVVEEVDDARIRNALELLFEEALLGPDPLEDLAEIPNGPRYVLDDPWAPGLSGRDSNHEHWCRTFGRNVLKHCGALKVHVPRVYYRDRIQAREPPRPPQSIDWPEVADGWGLLMIELVEAGYLARRAGDACVDGQENQLDDRINRLIYDRTALDRHWPPLGVRAPEELDDFLTVVEVMHDLVARPRCRAWHSYDEHHTYSLFSEATGQALYRWRVNELLSAWSVELELAEDGSEQGHLVQRVYDPRQELLREVTHMAPGTNVDLVLHAIAAFRRRGATPVEKRQACTALAHVLEDRRQVLSARINRSDEGNLFNIANNFAIRHQNARQHADYPEEYLDWIFWWYLATIELTNRLLRRSTE